MRPRNSSMSDQLFSVIQTHHSQMPYQHVINKSQPLFTACILRFSSFIACLIGVLASTFVSAASNPPPPSRESIEWCDIWISHANETNLPRVLLIGDSIARDYYPEVEKRLDGKAFVARLTTSRFIADPVLLKEIELVLNGAKFDVIHFNNGMHGWQHSEEAYRKAFPQLIKTIRAHAPKARLI